MKVLFLMFAFPDLNKSYNMYTTLVEEFVRNGHEVTVIAPGENTGLSHEAGIEVLRVASLPLKNVPNWVKGFSNLLLPWLFHRALHKYYKLRKFDLIISATPPVTFAVLAKRLKSKHQAIFYLILRDIFPQNAVDLGFMKKRSLAWKYFRRQEKQLYESADAMGCMSPGNINYLIKNEPWLKPNRLHLLPNFQKPFAGNTAIDLPPSLATAIANKFVVVFGGNMGKPQQLENVLQLAQYTQKYKDVLFLILGEGVQATKVRSDATQMGLSNIYIAGTMPKMVYQQLLQQCQLGLISLHIRFSIPNIPSKALDYWNVGLPILASIDRATDFGQLLDETQTGLWAYADEPKVWQQRFDELYHNAALRGRMAAAGKQYFVTELLPGKAYSTIMAHVEA